MFYLFFLTFVSVLQNLSVALVELNLSFVLLIFTTNCLLVGLADVSVSMYFANLTYEVADITYSFS